MKKKKTVFYAIVVLGICAIAGTVFFICDAFFSKSSSSHKSTPNEKIIVADPHEVKVEKSPLKTTFESTFDKVINQVPLTSNDLVNLNSDELRILRNIPFAKAGRYFKDASLTRYFNQFDWYSPYRWDVGANDISRTDSENVNFIKTFER